MVTDDLKKFIYLTAVLTVGVLAIAVWLMDDMLIGVQTVSRIPTAITATLFFWLFFAKWGWKWWPLSLLFRRPHVAGTWIGHLESDWQRAGNHPTTVIPIVFAIRQNFLSLVIRGFTVDRESMSVLAKLIVNEEAGVTCLSYIYSLREEFRAGQGSQQGAAELRVIGRERQELRGEYWTNTKTGGRLLLMRCSNEVVYSFGDARERWPIAQWPQFET